MGWVVGKRFGKSIEKNNFIAVFCRLTVILS